MLTGTLINYYFHCKRQLWLFYHKINMENNSEDVKIGKALHEEKYETDIKIENISVDKITSKFITEYKKSDADVEAAKAQLIFYMIKLKDKGINREGQLIFNETNKQDKKIIKLKLNEEIINKQKSLEEDIIKFLAQKNPPDPILDKKCKKCAYYEYCYI